MRLIRLAKSAKQKHGFHPFGAYGFHMQVIDLGGKVRCCSEFTTGVIRTRSMVDVCLTCLVYPFACLLCLSLRHGYLLPFVKVCHCCPFACVSCFGKVFCLCMTCMPLWLFWHSSWLFVTALLFDPADMSRPICLSPLCRTSSAENGTRHAPSAQAKERGCLHWFPWFPSGFLQNPKESSLYLKIPTEKWVFQPKRLWLAHSLCGSFGSTSETRRSRPRLQDPGAVFKALEVGHGGPPYPGDSVQTHGS